MKSKFKTLLKVGGYAAVAGAGIYVGMRVVNPLDVLHRSPDLWLRVSPDAVDKLKTGTAMIFENTPAGDLVLVGEKVPAAKEVLNSGARVLEAAA